jgi:hypothetical protein
MHDLRGCGLNHLADNTEQWGTIVNTVTSYRVPLQIGKFATS